MMNYPLLIKNCILERAKNIYPKKEIVSRDYNGMFRYNYGKFYERVCRLGSALQKLGVQRGDRIGTLAWNNHRHLELYFAVPCSGAVLHTLNLRLFTEQLIYVINHAADSYIFVDIDLVPLLENIQDKLSSVKGYVIMSPELELPRTKLQPAYSYEQLLSEGDPGFQFPADLDENTPASMCYTTATTGNPKGVVYTHRSIVLHSFSECMVDSLGVSEAEVVLPVVPMFHVNAWGLPFSCTMVGAKQVFPGARPDAKVLCQLFQDEKVTATGGVPTIWMAVLAELEREQYDLSSLKTIVNGGSALPRAILEGYRRKLGIDIVHAYGMTETSPLVLYNYTKSYLRDLPLEEHISLKLKQGLLVPGLEMRVVNEKGEDVPRDGRTMGELLLRGPWIAGYYYNEPERSRETIVDGWLRTNDIATVDGEGYVQIVDRTKDLIKSGGEWISSVDLENAIMSHPAVAEAAVIAMPHPRWDERPLACVVLKPGASASEEEIIKYLADKVAKWWLPDKVLFIDEIPKTSVGKFDKKVLRARYATSV